MNELISRQYAIANGLGKYFTGKPCRKGHVAERWVAGACVQCVSARKKELYQTNRDAVLAYSKVQSKIYRAQNKEACLERNYAWRKKNLDKVRAQEKARRLANPEKDRAKARKHYYAHQESELARQKKMANCKQRYHKRTYRQTQGGASSTHAKLADGL